MPNSLNFPGNTLDPNDAFSSRLKELQGLLIEGRSRLLAKDIAGFEAVLRKQALMIEVVVQEWREIRVLAQTKTGALQRTIVSMRQQVRRVVEDAKLQYSISRRLWEQSFLIYRAAQVSTSGYAAIAVSGSDRLRDRSSPQARNLWEASTQV